MNQCPKCNFQNNYNSTKCSNCGIIFANYKQHQIKKNNEKKNMLINCSACGKDISKNAESCPNCGEPNTKNAKSESQTKPQDSKKNNNSTKSKPSCIVIVGGGFILFCIFIALFGEMLGLEKSPPPTTTVETRQDKIEKNFSAWDGSHRNLTRIIKESMNDPSSYEHDKTVYGDKGDHLIVTTTFRGKNAFGGMVKNSVTAKVDLNGNVIEIISQNP